MLNLSLHHKKDKVAKSVTEAVRRALQVGAGDGMDVNSMTGVVPP